MLSILSSLIKKTADTAPLPAKQFEIGQNKLEEYPRTFKIVSDNKGLTLDGVQQNCDFPKAFKKKRLYLPALCVSAPIDSVDVKNDSLRIPRKVSHVGLSTRSSSLTDTAGTSLIAGHVKWNTELGVLYNLHKMYPGAPIVTTDVDNKSQLWRVTALKVYKKGKLPRNVFNTSGGRRLVIITCGGRAWNSGVGGFRYEDNVVVVAVPDNGAIPKPQE